MKDFMLIFTSTSYSELGLSPEELQNKMGNWFAWQAKMDKQGIVKGGHALKGEVRHIKGPDRIVTDRTSAELKEVVGGYYVVSAADLEEASKIAQDYPDYDIGGTVEIREIMVYEQG